MLSNKEGLKIPAVNFPVRANEEWQNWSTDELFTNKRVIVFSLPGAFTPTCSSTHLPRYNELAPVFRANGIDAFYCVSVNDTFVMNAWAEQQHADNVTFIPDGNGEFSEGMGMLVDKNDLGFGKRSWRYSMVVNNGVVEKMFIEPELPGDPFQVSDADTMLEYIAPEANVPSKTSIFTKPGCPHCARAKKLLVENGFSYEEIELGSNGLSYSSLTAVTGQLTTPQVFIDGVRVGGADELEAFFESRNPAGSIKCRIGANMIWAAEKAGQLKPGMTL